MRERVEQALRELPLSEEDIAKATPALLDRVRFLQQKSAGRSPQLDSPLFDYRRKVNAVVERFADNGLTLADYMRAAVQYPQLFYQAPDTVVIFQRQLHRSIKVPFSAIERLRRSTGNDW